MHSLATQDGVDGHAIRLGELLQFIDPHTALALLDGDQRRARNRYGISGLLLRHADGFAGKAQALAHFGR